MSLIMRPQAEAKKSVSSYRLSQPKHEDLMLTVLVIAASLMIGVIVALVLRQSGASDNTLPAKKPVRPQQIAAQDISPQIEAQRVETPAFPSLTPDAEKTDMYKGLRDFLLEGMNRIFDESATDAAPQSMPFLREQVDPNILNEALTHLEGLDQFRVQQIRLQKLVNDPTVQMTELSKNITTDPLLTAKILKMANSSYFGVAQKIDSIGHALMILGLQNVKNIVYREGLRGMFDAGAGHNKAAVAYLWRHSNLVCICAQHFHDLFFGLNRGTLFTLGIVHDIGKLILMDKFYMSGKATGLDEEYPIDVVIGDEDRFFKINHAVIGGCTLGHWNFSELMIQSVLMHHAPSFIAHDQMQLNPETGKYVLALFLADQTAKLFTDWNEGGSRLYNLHASYHHLIDRKKLAGKITDVNFLNQMRAAEMISLAENTPVRSTQIAQ